MACMTLVPRNAIPLLNFAHRCQMTAPKGGVGHHFHNRTEEMFVIFDGDAEFTIDGRTSRLKGTVGAPVRMGHSQYVDHLILTPGSSEGLHSHASVGEVYYVLDGEGQVTVAGESAAIGKGDGVPIVPDQAHAVANTGPRDLELMIIGIATEKGQLDTVVLK